jgi:hypothetical protein
VVDLLHETRAAKCNILGSRQSILLVLVLLLLLLLT